MTQGSLAVSRLTPSGALSGSRVVSKGGLGASVVEVAGRTQNFLSYSHTSTPRMPTNSRGARGAASPRPSAAADGPPSRRPAGEVLCL